MNVELLQASINALASACDGSSVEPRLRGESIAQYVSRLRAEAYEGDTCPVADMSWFSDDEIVSFVRKSYGPRMRHGDRYVGNDRAEIPQDVSVDLIRKASAVSLKLTNKYDWVGRIDLTRYDSPSVVDGISSHFVLDVHDRHVVQFFVDTGGKEPFKVWVQHSLDPRRNSAWRNVARGHAQYGYPYEVKDFPRDVRVKRIIRPVISVPRPTSGGSHEIVWLAEADVGMVALDWNWGLWIGDDARPHDMEVSWIPYGPTVLYRGKQTLLSDISDRCLTFREAPRWMLDFVKDVWSTAKHGKLTLPHNKRHDNAW